MSHFSSDSHPNEAKVAHYGATPNINCIHYLVTPQLCRKSLRYGSECWVFSHYHEKVGFSTFLQSVCQIFIVQKLVCHLSSRCLSFVEWQRGFFSNATKNGLEPTWKSCSWKKNPRITDLFSSEMLVIYGHGCFCCCHSLRWDSSATFLHWNLSNVHVLWDTFDR